MSKAKEDIQPEPVKKPTEGRGEKNGSIRPIINSAEASVSTPDFGADLGMEVDDGYGESAGEPEIQWPRQSYDRRSAYPSVASHPRTLGLFDTVSVNSTRSLYDSDLDYYMENNRRYASTYSQPNDEDEQLRLQIMHQVFLFLLKSQFTSIPLLNPTKILDVGTGTGDWVIGIGEAFPDAEVTGMDLSAIQPSAVPPNVSFEIFDAEDDDEWTYPQNLFDLIHFRNMTGSFRSWDKMYERVFSHVKPGGWIEVVDFDDHSNTFAKYFQTNSEIYNWYLALGEAATRSGKDVGPAHLHPERLSAAGFVDVKVTRYELPIGVWPAEPDVRSTAKLWLVACLAGFEAVSLRLLTRDLGWDPDEVLRLCRNVETDLKNLAMDKDKAKGLSASVKILVGRKPFPDGETDRYRDESETGLEIDDAQPEGKRIKIEERASTVVDPEIKSETTPHAGNDFEMN